ncbi:MAG: pyridoxal 4-dehydrogenase [Ramlibacter sp.]|jgi:D-threo-aldose 1-dehydrogenase|nr:pyridoxal 4-dehydrogenase [Ramlibacter sp.]
MTASPATAVPSFDPAGRRPAGGLSVSQLGVGCLSFGAPQGESASQEVQDTMTALHAAGVNYFDVAPMYGLGLAEQRLGEFLQRVDRQSVVISTKVGRLLEHSPDGTITGARFDYSYSGALQSLEESLERLQVDTVDLVLIHDVSPRWHGDALELRYAEAIEGTYRALAELRSCGVVRAIGVGVNDWAILERFARDGEFDCFMLAGRYTLLDHSASDSFLPMCKGRDIAVLLAAPFNSGLLALGASAQATYAHAPPSEEILARTARIETVCKRHGVSIAAAALQFPLAHPAIASVVAGMATPNEVRANLQNCATALPSAFWEELKDARLISQAAPVPSWRAVS